MSHRKPIIIGNWKMNKNKEETKKFFSSLNNFKSLNEYGKKCDFGFAPVYTSLETAISFKNSDAIIFAQNAHWEASGAFTGEISGDMLNELGINNVIIGHSERRSYFNETDDTINKKLHTLTNNNFNIILCVGENINQYQAGETNVVIHNQLSKDLKELNSNQISKIIIAYEPIWAIGTGKTATPEIAQTVCHFIRGEIKSLFGGVVADKIRIQYGGSVKPNNVASIMQQKDIDGALVGGAALDAESFFNLIKNTVLVY